MKVLDFLIFAYTVSLKSAKRRIEETGENMEKKGFYEIHCPQCGKEFRTRKGKPRTLKQWQSSLMNHLTASEQHHLETEKAKSVIAKHFKLLDSTFS